MQNLILIAVLALILGAAITYIIKAKKAGVKCIGCSAAGCCNAANGKCSCSCAADM